ncbi:MAG: hypothetical protein JW751_22935 [Polyangiaceae bacterium]|nr:hypothetical protein [Polyangiaceae bacterium]
MRPLGQLPAFSLVVVGASLLGGCIGVSAKRPGGAAGSLRACPAGVAAAPDGLIDDFEDGDNRTAAVGSRGGYWWKSTDSAGSFFGPDDWGPIKGGANGSFALHLMGQTVSGDPTEAWGAQVGGNFVGSGFYDATAYVGISFKAKTTPKSVKTFRLEIADVNSHPTGEVCTACWNHFGKWMTFTSEWKEYKVLFADLQQEEGWGDPRPDMVTPTQIYAIQWKIKPGSDFDFMIDDLHFLACE